MTGLVQGLVAGAAGLIPARRGQPVLQALTEVPVERRFSQASTTRAAMPASAALPMRAGRTLLVADLAVDLEHAVVVVEHVARDRPGEGVLGVGVDVHLDHAVVDRRADLLGRRAGAAVEDQVERAGAGRRPSFSTTASWACLRISGAA